MKASSKSFQYVSTRSSEGTKYTFEDVLLQGFAPDGGLFVPAEIPRLSQTTLEEWSNMSYPNLVVEIAQLFISPEEIPHLNLTALIYSALTSFKDQEIIPTKEISKEGNVQIVELYNGATLAFKDLAMTCTAKFIEYFLEKRAKHLHVMVATSGDTGAAALSAFGGSPKVDVTVLYPLGRVTDIQELQMATLAAAYPNLQLFGINGTSDDGDDIIKTLFNDEAFNKQYNLSSVNSINWSRILIQIAHHFLAYFKVSPDCRGTVEVAVPTGAAGNLAAGTFAQAMGLPIRLVACVNENDFVHRMLSQGVVKAEDRVHQTLASAMDIQMAYNIERILYVVSNGDSKLIQQFAAALKTKSSLQLPTDIRTKLSSIFSSSKSTDQDIVRTIAQSWNDDQYRICPHTATAVHYHAKTPIPAGVSGRACLATASPGKFPQALVDAGVPVPGDTEGLSDLQLLPQKVVKLTGDRSNWIPSVRKAIQDLTKTPLVQ